MIEFNSIDTPQALNELVEYFLSNGIKTLAMDFEEESNLHVYGEHLCLVQLYDGKQYYAVDALEICKTQDGTAAMKNLLESSIEKIMFDCSSDAAIARKTLGIQLKEIFDIRIIAQTLGFTGNLTGLIERNLKISSEDPMLKKKYQRADWMRRPLPLEQLEYALDDVKYLFDLKNSLVNELKTLPVPEQKRVAVLMRHCAQKKHGEKPGWEKICNYKALNKNEKIYLRNFFMARDGLARKANCPPTCILEKQLLVQMAHNGTWEGSLYGAKLRYSGIFEKARLKALEELKACPKIR